MTLILFWLMEMIDWAPNWIASRDSEFKYCFVSVQITYLIYHIVLHGNFDERSWHCIVIRWNLNGDWCAGCDYVQWCCHIDILNDSFGMTGVQDWCVVHYLIGHGLLHHWYWYWHLKNVLFSNACVLYRLVVNGFWKFLKKNLLRFFGNFLWNDEMYYQYLFLFNDLV